MKSKLLLCKALFIAFASFLSINAFGQLYLPIAGEHDTIYIPSSTFTNTSDPGGPGGSTASQCGGFSGVTANNYPNCNCTTSITICPDEPGRPVILDFYEFNIGSTTDFLVLYDSSTTAGNIVYSNGSGGPQSGDDCTGPVFYIAQNATGCLTLSLFASSSLNYPGFAVNMSRPENRDLSVVEMLPVSSIVPGPQNVQVRVHNLGFDNVTNFTLEWTINGTPQTPVPVTTSLQFYDTTNYISLGTVPINAGDEVKVWATLINGGADQIPANDTLTRQFCEAMTGNFTINSALPTAGSNFATFTEAVDSLTFCGIAGPVVFDVAPGSYTEQIRIPSLVGTSATNTVTFRAQNGDSTSVSLNWPTSATATDNYTLWLDGASYVTFEKMTIERNGAQDIYQVVVEFGNGSSNLTFQNLVVQAPDTALTSTGQRRASFYSANGAAHNNVIIRNSRILGNTNGTWLDGDAATSSNVLIENNYVSTPYTGIFVLNHTNATIRNNYVERSRPALTTEYFGISLNIVNGPTRITGNTLIGHGGQYGLRMRDVYGDAANRVLVANNFMQSGGSTTSLSRAVSVESGNGYIDFFHNSTLVSGGSNTLGRGFSITDSGNSSFRIKYNSFANTGGGYAYFTFDDDAPNAIEEFDYNNFYFTGPQIAWWRWGTARSFADFQALSGFNANSFNLDPRYVSSTDLHLSDGALKGLALPEALVTTDIDGEPRNAVYPTIGADEYIGSPNDVGIQFIVSPANGIAGPAASGVEARIANFGNNTVTSATIQWSVNGTPQPDVPYTGSLVPGQGDTVNLGNYTFAGGDMLKVWTSMPNGIADVVNTNDTVQTTLCIGLAGNYTINKNQPNGPTNFNSFADLVVTLAGCGVAGPVVVSVEPGSGPYTEQIRFNSFAGSSAANTLTIKGNLETLQFAPVSSNRSILQFQGAKNMILDSLVIKSTATDYGFGIVISDTTANLIIRNCVIDLSGVTSTSTLNSYGIVVSNSVSTSVSTANAQNHVIEKNTIIGGAYGYRSEGSFAKNIVFRNNTLIDWHTYGIYLNGGIDHVVSGNDISRPNRLNTGSSAYGIYLSGSSLENALVEKNRIHNTHQSQTVLTGTVYGIYSSSAGSLTVGPTTVQNNLIYNFNSNGTWYGIYNSGSDNHKYYHNTISFDNTTNVGGTTYGFYQTSAAEEVEFKNNIVSITRGGIGNRYGVFFNTTTSEIESDYNVFHVNSGGTGSDFVGHFGTTAAGTSYATLVDWQTANSGAYDQNSIQRNPRFLDLAINDLTPTSPIINDQGTPVGVMDDIFGNPRSATTPDMGAIEFSPLPDDAGIVQILSPTAPLTPGTYPITVSFQNFGGLNLTEVNIYATIFDGTNTTTLPVTALTGLNIPSAGLDTANIGSYNFTGGNYTITVWTSDPNGNPDANNVNDTLVFNICTALAAGNYTIDATSPVSATNFQSFNAAVSALSCGILGDVTFTVAAGSGPYNEQVTIPAIPGSGPTAHITFDGQDRNDIVLTHDASIKWATVLLQGTDYITFQNMTIENTNSTNGFGIQLMMIADHVSVLNSNITMSTTATSINTAGIAASGSETSATVEANNCNYLTVDNVMFTGAYAGIRFEGSTAELLKGNVINNSQFLHQNVYGIWADKVDSIYITGNYVDSLRSATLGKALNILLGQYFEVMGNKFYSPDICVVLDDCNLGSAPTQRSKFINNFVYGHNDWGLHLLTTEKVDIFHNTVVALGSAMRLITNTKGLDVRNNIFYSLGSYAIEDGVAAATSQHVDFDYNIYYTTGPVLARMGGTSGTFDYLNLAAWRTAFPAFNDNAVVGDPLFVGPRDFHLVGLLANDIGDNSVGVTIDIDGDTRPLTPSTTVDIGADEYAPLDVNIQVVGVATPRNQSCGDSTTQVSVVIFNQGAQPQSNFDIEVDVTGSATQTLTATYTGTINTNEYDTVVVGSINTYQGGTYNLFIEHLLVGDQFPSNDTLSVTLTLLPIPLPPTAIGDTGCVGDFLELTADLTGFAAVEWYDDAALTNNVGSGDVFFTPSLSATTTYYAVGQQGARENVGRLAPAGTSTFTIATNGYGMYFEVFDDIVIDSVTIFTANSGTISFDVIDLNNGNTVIWTSPVRSVVSSGVNTVGIKVPVNFAATPGRYVLGINTYSGISLVRETGVASSLSYPYVSPSGRLAITSSNAAAFTLSTSNYYWFYDWVVRIPGCNSPATEVVALISNTQSNAGPDQDICAGETATLTAQNGVSWLWTGGANTQSINVTPTNTTTYSLTVTDAFGCTGTVDQVTVIVNPLPTVITGNDTTICTGESVTFTAIGATTYEWSNGASTASITANTSGTYSVTGTDANGCSNAAQATLTVRALPSGNAGADEEICVGGTADLLATGGFSYEWSTGENTADISVSPTNTTPYTLTTTDQFGCVGEDTVTVTVNALPVLTILGSDTVCISQGAVTLTANPSGGTFTGPGVTSGQFDPSAVGAGTYTITYSYTDGNGCSNTATKQVVVDNSPACTPGVGTLAGLGGIGVYPNPFTDKVSIKFTATSSEPVTISMYNLLGQVIFTAEVEVIYGENNYTIETDRSLAEGFYVIELRKGEDAYLEKLLRVR